MRIRLVEQAKFLYDFSVHESSASSLVLIYTFFENVNDGGLNQLGKFET